MWPFRRNPRGGVFLVRALESLGVRHVVSLPGSQMLAVWDAIAESSLELTVPRSENVGAMMANGYGRVSDGPCVVMNTLGPGVGNELSALHDAQLGQSPVVLICPVHPLEKYGHIDTVFQGFEQAAFLAPYSKLSLRVDAAADLGSTLGNAVASSLTQPMGPVRVDVAFPLFFERHDFGPLPSSKEPAARKRGDVVVADRNQDVARFVTVAGTADYLWPATGHPDDAIAFAAGATLGHDGTTTLIVAADTLARNVHALSNSSGRSLKVALVSTDTTDRTTTEALARCVGADHRKWGDECPVSPQAGCLTIVVRP